METSQRTLTTACEDEGLRGVHCNASDVVGMGLKHVNSFQGVVIKNSDLHVILAKGGKPQENKSPVQGTIYAMQRS